MILTAVAVFAQATLTHTFAFEANSPLDSVHLCGTFNNWTIGSDPMKLEAGTRRWTITKSLAPGVYQYKFVLNGNEWITDPKAEKNEDDGNGNTNSVINLLTPEMRKPASRTDAEVSAALLMHRAELPFVTFDRNRLRLKLQARKNDLSRVSVVIGDKVHQLSLVDSDDVNEWYAVSIPWTANRGLRYQFNVASGPAVLPFGPRGLSRGDFVMDGRAVKPADVPTWPEQSVLYQIFPDRFENGDKSNDPPGVQPWNGTPTYGNFFGGDVAGVRKRIPYLKKLGVRGVYFNPIFKSPSNHGYETTDYLQIEPRYGANTEFAAMTRELKQNGIRTVLDGVFNHTATNFAPFADVLRNGEQSRFKDWYTIKSYPVKVGDPPNYEAWFGFPSMPKVNTENPEARKYMLSVPGFWDKTADIAGWRLDVANEVPMPFWRSFRGAVKALGQDKWIIGEVWGDGSQWLKGDQWDSIMGYQFRDAVLKFIASRTMKPSEYFRQLMRVHESYAPGVSRNLMILLGSHDTPRILTLCGGDRNLAKIAATLQLTWIGAPSIYYGDEIGMAGDRDPDNRRGMRWPDATDQNDMLKHYRTLISARNGSKALQSGDAKLILADDAKGVLAYSRSLGDEFAFTVINRSDQIQTVNLKVPKGRWANCFGGRPVSVIDGTLKLNMSPKSSAVFRPSVAR